MESRGSRGPLVAADDDPGPSRRRTSTERGAKARATPEPPRGSTGTAPIFGYGVLQPRRFRRAIFQYPRGINAVRGNTGSGRHELHLQLTIRLRAAPQAARWAQPPTRPRRILPQTLVLTEPSREACFVDHVRVGVRRDSSDLPDCTVGFRDLEEHGDQRDDGRRCGSPPSKDEGQRQDRQG